MKKYVIVAILFLLGSGSFAQSKKKVIETPGSVDTAVVLSKPNEHKDKYKELNLTDEQKGKIKELNKRNKTEKSKIEGDAALTPEQKSAKLKELKKEQSKSFKAILTTEQLEKYKAGNKKIKDNE